MVKLADTLALGASARKSVGVQVSLPAQIEIPKGGYSLAKPKTFNHTAVFSTEISPLPAGRQVVFIGWDK